METRRVTIRLDIGSRDHGQREHSFQAALNAAVLAAEAAFTARGFRVTEIESVTSMRPGITERVTRPGKGVNA